MKFPVSLLALSTITVAQSVLQDNTNSYGIPAQGYPGYNLNLQELRLVKVGPSEPPVWWTELQKARNHFELFGTQFLSL